MGFCKYCGNEIKKGVKFCNHCGKSLQESQAADEQSLDSRAEQLKEDQGDVSKEELSSDDMEEKDSKEDSISKDGEAISKSEASATTDAHSSGGESDKQSLNQKQKQAINKQQKKSKNVKKKNILIFSGLGLVVLLIAGYVILNKMNSPSHLVKEFEEAINEEDSESLASILTTEEKELEINKDTMDAFIKLYSSKSSDLRNMINQLEAQADGHGSGYSMYPVELVKDGKKFLLFDNYKLNLLPVYINVSTTYADTDILVNGEKIATADEEYFSDEVGPITPGVHTVKAVYDTGFFHLDKETEVEASDPGIASLVDLHLEGDNVSFDLSTNRYDQLSSVKLYINGKETDYDLTEESRIGPLLTDGTMNASFEADFPWGTMKTEEVPIDDSYIQFNFGESEEFRQDIMDLIITFNEEFIEAYTTADAGAFTSTTIPLQEAILEEVDFNKEQDIVYKGAFHGVDFYLDSFELKKSYDDFWEVNVDTITYFEEDMYLVGDNDNLQQTEEEIRYEVIFNPQSKEWVIADLGYAGSMDEDRMERYKVDDPVTHTSEWDKKKKKGKKDKD